MKRIRYFLIPLLLASLSGGCGGRPEPGSPRVTGMHPHDPGAYTQGLLFLDGRLFESTGLYGQSTVREVDPASGEVLRKVDLPAEVFGEGLTFLNGRFFVLTWRAGIAYELAREDFSVLRQHRYAGEGWGLTTDGRHLIMSDGTSTLQYIDPEDFSVIRTLRVTGDDGQPLTNLNELEFVNGRIYANLYMQDRIAVIDPASGRAGTIYDFSALRASLPRPNRAEVLNGIAHDPATGRFFITGKRWPILYIVEIDHE